jgi:tripartite-type tricarboxylate transporter receptor subunit TctC
MPLRSLITALLLGCMALSGASAQDWPTKPIRLIVPAPPGGITDGVARLLGEQLRAQLGQPVIVDNKPGGSAVIAERALMAAPPDGHTLMVTPSSVLTDFPFTVKTPFDPHQTFRYIADVASMVHVLVANTQVPQTRVADVLEHARQHKGTVSIANLSPGTRSELLAELLSEKSGRNVLVVPYKGSAPAMVDLLGNQVQLTFEVVSNVAPMVKAGKLKGLAIVSAARSPHLPEVPSFGELGLPEFVLPDASVGVAILNSMAGPLRDRIRRELETAMRAPKFREALAAQGFDAPPASTLEDLQRKLALTIEQNRAIVGRLKLGGDAR